MLNNDWDPYDQLLSLIQSNYEMAKALNDQASTIETLIKNAKHQKQQIQHLNERITNLEIGRETG